MAYVGYTGTTIRVQVTFYDYVVAGDPPGPVVDPSSVTVNTYDADSNQLGSNLVPVIRVSTGVYYYDWTLPENVGVFYIEFVGIISSEPTIFREKVLTKFNINP